MEKDKEEIIKGLEVVMKYHRLREEQLVEECKKTRILTSQVEELQKEIRCTLIQISDLEKRLKDIIDYASRDSIRHSFQSYDMGDDARRVIIRIAEGNLKIFGN